MEKEVLALREKGMSMMDISKEVNTSLGNVINILRDNGDEELLNANSAGFLDSDENKLRVIELKEAGNTQQQIADEVGLSKSAVARFLRRVTHKEWWAEYDAIPAQIETETEDSVTDVVVGVVLDLADDSTKTLVKEMKEQNISLKDISTRTGISYHTVRNFLLKNTYKDWWESDSAEVDDNYRGLSSEANKILAISLTAEGKSPEEVGEKIGITAQAVTKFLNKETYASWWDSRVVPPEEVEAIIDELIEEETTDPLGNKYVEVEDGYGLSAGAKYAGIAVGVVSFIALIVILANTIL